MADLSKGITAGPVEAFTAMPRCGIASGTMILTLTGVMSVECVAPGDKVITRAGARTVTAVEIAVVQDARVIRISQGVLGKDRPEADLHVSPRQPLLIRDWRAKALSGLVRAVMTPNVWSMATISAPKPCRRRAWSLCALPTRR